MTTVTEAQVTLERFTPERAAEWDAFVRESQAPHFYNETAFFSHYARKAREVHPLCFRKRERLIAVIPLGLVETEQGMELRSPFSSSFGGFSAGPMELADAYRCVELLEEYAAQRGCRALVIQQPPLIYYRSPNEVWEFVLQASGFSLEGCELSYWVPVDGQFSARMSGSTRWAVNRAVKRGLRFEEERLPDAYAFTARAREAKGLPLSVSREDLEQLGRAFPDRIHCARATLEGRTLAVSINYRMSAWASLCMFWARDYGVEEELRPLDFLLTEYVAWARGQGIAVYDFGTTTLGGKPEWGVTRYKEKFAPLGAMRKRFRKALGA